MPVRCGHHGVSGTERIGQCSRSDLRFRQVRCEVNIRGADESHQLIQLNETVKEDDVLLHTEVLGEPFQAQAISLAFVAQKVWVRLPQHDVNDVREIP